MSNATKIVKSTYDNFVFRRAVPTDWLNVFNLNRNIYNGKDHLSCKVTFQQMLSRPYNHAFVACDKETVVSFMMVSFVDDGRTSIGRFGRTRAGYEGSGVQHRLRMSSRFVFEYYPFIKDFVAVRMHDGGNFERNTNLGKADALYMKPRASYHFVTAQELVPKCEAYAAAHQDSLIPLSAVTDTEKRHLLTDEETSQRLFNDGRVLIDLMVYKTIPENYDIIIENENPHVLAQYDSEKKCVSMSFGTKYDLYDPAKMRYKIDIYAKTLQETTSHLFRQIWDAIKLNPGRNIAFIVCIDEIFTDTTKQLVFDECRKLGMKEVSWSGEHSPYHLVSRIDMVDLVRETEIKESKL